MKTGGNPTLATTMMVAPGWVPALLMPHSESLKGSGGITRRSSWPDELWRVTAPELQHHCYHLFCHPR